MFGAKLRFKIAGESAIAAEVRQAREGVADGLQPVELVVKFSQILLVADEGAVTRGNVPDVELVGGYNKIAGKFVEAFEEGKRHGRRQQRPQDGPVKVQMGRLAHVPQVGFQA